ncbi:NAD(P)-dependent oxidoreductase [Myroides guanonis]|uniref:NADH-flavin reductase n=1 Tax=Myroides guanonis TaxID=1150112 RepID=A0A1I3UXF2_9FLAO|nr:NAD(P)-binding oxidoreductase [Myroides guanonis]SFJ88064.1 Putative NADH-flavin reductase [Myroides guanonis]
MKIVVFGATGTVGLEIVKQALERGYEVTAFARDPEKLSELRKSNLLIHKGDVLNSKDVEDSIARHDAVICSLGDGRIGKIRAKGTLNIIQSMDRLNIKRFICLSTLGVGDSYENLNFIWKHIMFGFFLKSAFKDHKLQEHYIFKSSLIFTIVRPSALINGAITNDFKIGFDGKFKDLNLKISKEDVANFLLEQLHKEDYLMQAVSISN